MSLALLMLLAPPIARAADRPPNIILILCDNLGYGDVGCYGSRLQRTPHIDRLAAEGIRFTDCYAASGVCTPSRAALMTGCYPLRVSLHVSDRGTLVLQPVSPKGLHPDEITIADALKSRGYATMAIGKWHLGDQPALLPTRQGFDHYFGIPYSDDMTQREEQPWPPLPLMRDEVVVEAPVDRNLLTQRYTDEAVRFITRHKDQPFFLYLPHAMPGSTQQAFSSPEFRGRSANGHWGDSVEEIDASTGRIVETVDRLGLARDTLIIWTNDNGAPRRDPLQGTNTPLKGWGYDVSEGAMRVPFIVRWPGHAPAGVVCRELCSLIDVLPTAARLAGAELPAARAIDGRDIGPLLTNPAAPSPHEAFYYYYMDQLQAVRSGPWKLYLSVARRTAKGPRKAASEAELYNLADDLAETRNLAAEQPDVVARLLKLAERARVELGDLDRPSPNQRPAGIQSPPTPRVKP